MVVPAGKGAVPPKPGKSGREDPPMARQRWREAHPVEVQPTESVQKDDGWPLTAVVCVAKTNTHVETANYAIDDDSGVGPQTKRPSRVGPSTSVVWDRYGKAPRLALCAPSAQYRLRPVPASHATSLTERQPGFQYQTLAANTNVSVPVRRLSENLGLGARRCLDDELPEEAAESFVLVAREPRAITNGELRTRRRRFRHVAAGAGGPLEHIDRRNGRQRRVERVGLRGVRVPHDTKRLRAPDAIDNVLRRAEPRASVKVVATGGSGNLPTLNRPRVVPRLRVRMTAHVLRAGREATVALGPPQRDVVARLRALMDAPHIRDAGVAGPGEG